jgi:prepilin-type N-terminal cleavage/methylation domain-containing protein
MAETALTRTSPQTTCRGFSGFSLIELLVVVGLIAVVSMLAIPSISSYFGVSMNSAAREIATTMKETYNATMLTGRVHRVAFDLKEHVYWAEIGPTTMLLETKESKEKDERRRKFSRDEGPKDSGFSLDTSVTRKKRPLPRGVQFEDIATHQSDELVTDGTAYSHIFPNGLTERVVIHLRDSSKHRITLVTSALIGRTDMYERYVSATEALGER